MVCLLLIKSNSILGKSLIASVSRLLLTLCLSLFVLALENPQMSEQGREGGVKETGGKEEEVNGWKEKGHI